MLAQQLAGQIAGAPLSTLDDLSRDLWRAVANDMISDDDAQALAEAIHARRQKARGGEGAKPAAAAGPRLWSHFPPKRVQRSPDRARSIERRRTLAASGPMPPPLAAKFTTGELATLRIVVDEVNLMGSCMKTLAEIAARAGIGTTTARNAIRQAARLGLVTVEERRRHGKRNLSNVVRIVSRAWMVWIERGGGFKKRNPTDTKRFIDQKRGGWNPPSRPSCTGTMPLFRDRTGSSARNAATGAPRR